MLAGEPSLLVPSSIRPYLAMTNRGPLAPAGRIRSSFSVTVPAGVHCRAAAAMRPAWLTLMVQVPGEAQRTWPPPTERATAVFELDQAARFETSVAAPLGWRKSA